ncbi:MAG: WYL domain-containing protein [Novosphingobium sp.]
MRPVPQGSGDDEQVLVAVRLGSCAMDERGDTSSRVIRPVIIGYFDETRMLAAWCELGQDFRHFRTDRVTNAEFLEDRHGTRSGVLRARWKRSMNARLAARVASAKVVSGRA